MSISIDEIRALRRRLGLTQAQLAEKLCLSREAVTQWENGRATPKGPAEILLRHLQAEADMKTPVPAVISENLSESAPKPIDA